MSELRALVSGASSGIGAAFCRHLRARGEKLILVARRADRLKTLSDELGGEAVASPISVDLADPDGAARLAAEVATRGFAIDLLVNNAGAGHTGPFYAEPLDRILGMIDLNVRSLVELTRRLLPGMLERRRGAIINVASNAAFQPVPFLTVYAATKSFVLSFTEGLATELHGTGVRVQALCPGLTSTEFLSVAGTHGQGLKVDRMPQMTADDVVTYSLKSLDRGRLRAIPGFANRLMARVERFVPDSLVRAVSASLYRPKGA